GSPPQDAVNRSGSAGLGQSSPAGSAEPAQGNNAESALADPHAGREDERETDGLYSDGGEPERKLLDIETAIARGLIPPELGMEHIKRTGDQEKASPPHQA
ncbi:MAG: hypothetical protein KAW49_10415, partial [Anaerolineae bacterium]|nr:hypothetical protein [Anaerolineae bacterium]